VAQFDHVSVTPVAKETEVIPDFNTEESTRLHVEIYPNPATDEVNISIPENEGKIKLAVTSMEGKVQTTKEFSGSETQLDVSRFQPGFYLVIFDRDGEIVTRRLVVI